jgi:serine/threonine protein kinase
MARKLHRIVTPIADGTVKVSGNFGPLENVCYLIFEKAKGNIRDEVVQFAEFDLAWCLRSLHNSAVGLQQLHSIGIAHQDIKPSNILVFTDNGSKISDLGCASELSVLSPRDGFPIPGDTGYAPPELFYNINTQRSFSERCIADIFLLGSLFFFYFAKCSATQAIHSKIKGFKGVNFTNNDFINDLPYIRQAFQEAIIDLESQIRPFAGTLTPSIIQLVSELCEPDPQRRGDPLKIGTSMSQHDLERFISAINLLAMKAEFNLK